MPEFIDLEMEGPFGHAANWYMQGPFVSALPEFGYQSPLSRRALFTAPVSPQWMHTVEKCLATSLFPPA